MTPSRTKHPTRLLKAVAVCAVGAFVAFETPYPLLDQVVLVGCFATLFSAILHARFGAESLRPYYVGFATAGGLYVLAAYGPFDGRVRKDLVTESLLDRVLPRPVTNDNLKLQAWDAASTRLKTLGHGVISLLVGLCGGLLAQRLARASNESRTPAPEA